MKRSHVALLLLVLCGLTYAGNGRKKKWKPVRPPTPRPSQHQAHIRPLPATNNQVPQPQPPSSKNG